MEPLVTPSTKAKDAKPRASTQVPHNPTKAFLAIRPLSMRSIE
jgi:hypothetical protein